ncbi:hypothetical protein QTP88_012224 [Uroleucon formosanum]
MKKPIWTYIRVHVNDTTMVNISIEHRHWLGLIKEISSNIGPKNRLENCLFHCVINVISAANCIIHYSYITLYSSKKSFLLVFINNYAISTSILVNDCICI